MEIHGIIQFKHFYLLDFSLGIWKFKDINNNITICVIWLWDMVFFVEGETQANGIWKQDPEANILMMKKVLRMESGEGSTMKNFIVCTVQQIVRVTKCKKIK